MFTVQALFNPASAGSRGIIPSSAPESCKMRSIGAARQQGMPYSHVSHLIGKAPRQKRRHAGYGQKCQPEYARAAAQLCIGGQNNVTGFVRRIGKNMRGAHGKFVVRLRETLRLRQRIIYFEHPHRKAVIAQEV